MTIKKDLGGNLSDYPNDKYKKFFDKFPEINKLETENWGVPHILSYFCKKYEEQYKVKYSFKFNSPSPTKCFEVFQIKKLAMQLSSNPTILKEYIDWVYLNKVVKAKRRLTSISFMTHEDIVNEYKMNVLLPDKKNNSPIDRTTNLPSKYKVVFDNIGFEIKTYGDLSFVSQMNPLPENLNQALNELQNLGFDKEILARII